MTRHPRYRPRLFPYWVTELIGILGLVAFILVVIFFVLPL